jgi:deferrochelatase/peroxidase EfeB
MARLGNEVLRDIQGMVLSGYGHLGHSSYLLLEFHDAAGARAWVGGRIPDITNATRYERRADGTRMKPRGALNLAFTHTGLRALGIPERALNSFSREFIEGMPSRADVLGDFGDSAPDHWQFGGPHTAPVHALLMIFGPDERTLDEESDRHHRLIEETNGAVTIVADERGARPESQREPFGFRDGLSQPRVEAIAEYPTASGPVVRTGEFILGHENEYGILPPTPGIEARYDDANLLPAFPGVAGFRDLGRNGTYLAYRKLEQDVTGFWTFVQENADCPPEVDQRERNRRQRLTAAKLVGRWPDGKPLVLYPENEDEGWGRGREHRTDFRYMDRDPLGEACPVGAHIRRANPRDSIMHDSVEDSFLTTNRHRIIRRGMPYGEPVVPPERLDDYEADIVLDGGHERDGADEKRGLHFIAINANLKRQFEFVMQDWADNQAFNGLYDNPDSVIGATDGRQGMTIQAAPLRRRLQNVPRFVHVRGGAYLFLPGLAALRFLARGPSE